MWGKVPNLNKAATLWKSAEFARTWLVEQALPLWGTAGFDTTSCMFEEQLDFERRPVEQVPRRLMVQARQISVFARAAIEGDFPEGRKLASTAGHSMISLYLEADGAPGWVFSLDRKGRVIDNTRDLYAHAFVLFALAWLHRLDKDPLVVSAIRKTLTFLDFAFLDQLHGGYWDRLPRDDALRRQNPHMHLFEALIELYEIVEEEAVLERCRRLDRLARLRFIAPKSGALREFFNDDWSVFPSMGRGSVEPGHQFEWAWLWRRFEAISGENRDVVVNSLIEGALVIGVDASSGRIVDEVGENGIIRKHSSRSWPHAEAIKAIGTEICRGREELIPLFNTIVERISNVYCRTDLRGGWIDHADELDRPLSRVMPASSLYHLYYGLKVVATVKAATLPILHKL